MRREVQQAAQQQARRELVQMRERDVGVALAMEDLVREAWEEELDSVAVDAWLDWEEVQRRGQQMRVALVRRVRGKRGVGMGRRRRQQRRRAWLLAEQQEREQVQREVRQRLDYVRWLERQESKWAAAAAAAATATAATAAGVQARWWVRKGQVGRRGRAAAAAVAAAVAASAAERSSRTHAAPASLCRCAERVPQSRPRHGRRGKRLGGGGKRGWVT